MKVSVTLRDGMLPDDFGKYSAPEDRAHGDCVRSFPIAIEEVPEAARTLALSFVDYDSTPVCGFTWIHWLACNIPADVRGLPDGASRSGLVPMIEGCNSCWSRRDALCGDTVHLHGYIGPCPPDKDHVYTLRVYALDKELDLPEGYFYNEFHWAIQDSVIDCATLNIASRA